MKKKWLLYPEKDVYEDGSVVAQCYLTEMEEYPICIVRSYSKYYRVEVSNIKRTIIDIPYDDVKLRRLNRKLLRKQKRGQITLEQHTKIILRAVCSMVEERHIF